MRTENYTDAYSPKEIKDKEKFLLWVKVKKRLIYILKVLNCIFALGVGLMFVYPFAWMASMSLRPLTEALKFNPNIIIKNPVWDNYIFAWNQARISHYIGNSLIYSALVIGLQYLTIIPAAYAFATMEFKGKKIFVGSKVFGHDAPRRSDPYTRLFFL